MLSPIPLGTAFAGEFIASVATARAAVRVNVRKRFCTCASFIAPDKQFHQRVFAQPVPRVHRQNP
jgi:hypothetical protein